MCYNVTREMETEGRRHLHMVRQEMVFDRGAEEHKIVQTLGDGYCLAPNMKSCHMLQHRIILKTSC